MTGPDPPPAHEPESALIYRPCTEQDIPAVLALWERADAVPRPTDHERALRVRLRRDRELFLLAVDSEQVVGSLVAGWDGWRGNMYRLAVDPVYRRRGVAEELVRRAEDELRRLGAERITSLVFVEEEGPAAFWTRQGYERDTAVQRFFKNLPRPD